MNATYVLLAITSLLILFLRNKNAIFICILITNICALYQGITNAIGWLYLLGLAVIAGIYFKHKYISNWAKALLFIVLAISVAGFTLHLVPGFFNVQAVAALKLSSLSTPFAMHLNFDKTMATLIIYCLGCGWQADSRLSLQAFLQTMVILLICLIFVVPTGCLLGYIKFDPKLSEIIWLWTLNNFLFVSVSEEIFFRWFCQQTWQKILLAKYSAFWPILIAASIFGLAHFKGGVAYILLAGVCGMFYGYAYFKTKSLLAAVLVHFGLNLVHFLLFTYPSAVNTVQP